MAKNPIREKKIKKIKRIRKWKKRSIVVLSIFVFLILSIVMMLYTSLGVKITTFILEKSLPELKIEKVEGTLSDLHINGMSLELPGIDIKVNDASLKLSGLCLIKTKVCINNFETDGVTVSINTEKLSKTPDEPIDQKSELIKTPIPIELKKTHLTNIKVNVNDMQFSLTDLTGEATWVNEKIYVFPTVAKDLSAIFADQAQDTLVTHSVEDNIPLNEKINQLFNQPLIESLPEISIPLNINVNRLTGDNWLLHIGGQDYRFNQVTIQTEIKDNHIIVQQVDTDAKTPFVNGHAFVSGKITLGNDWPLDALVKVNTANDQLDGKFSGKLFGVLATNLSIKGVNNVSLNGNINFIENYLPVMVKINGKHIQWPIEGNSVYQLNNFDLSIDGNVQRYKLVANGDIKGQNLPDTSFDFSGNGTNQSATFDRGMIKFPQGKIDISGNIDWQKALQWDSSITLSNVDITKEFPDFPIRLNGKLKTTGMFEGNKWQLNLPIFQLKGNIKQANFASNGNVQINSQNVINAKNFEILWGNNRINIDGASDKGNLEAKINLASLSLFLDDLQGTIAGNIKFNGDINDPIINTNLTVNKLMLQDISIASAMINGKVKYQHQVSGQLKITGQNISLPNQIIKKANIDLSGNENHHILDINLAGTPASFSTKLIGEINNNRTKWVGNVSQALLTLGEKNHWQLTKSLPLSYDITTQIPTIDAHCWHNNQSSICLDKALSLKPNTETSITLKDIDLAKLPIPNDGETKITGTINGHADIKFTSNNKIPTIKANIKGDKVYVQQMITSQSLPIPFDIFNINAEFNEQQANLDWLFSLKQLGKISGNLTIIDPIEQKKLSGQLNIDHLALAIINPLLDKNDYAKGAIDGSVKFSGSLMDPYLTGGIDLQHSEIKSSQLPIDLKSAKLNIDFNGKSSTLKGTLTTQSGNININGNASWNTIEKWQAQLTINGAAMEVTVPPMIVMTVVPDIKINASQDELILFGKVNIPKGKITVESLPPSSVDVSPDEVMLDKNYQVIEPQKFGTKISSHLEIVIGDKVSVDAFGLNASLKGNLMVAQTNKGLDLHGEVLIPKGRFHAYGQDLVIRKGIITFSGPTDQALLDIEAIRNPDSIENSNITAGIRVTGSSEEPKIEIFSDPAMSQQEALSYLIRGQGLESNDQSDNDMMTALLVGIGTAKTGKYIGDIGNVFGIKNLSLDTQGAGNNSKVVVSGYILPHLQLKYGVGIFDSLATFTLRYRLIPSLYLEATSGLAQTLDLIYQFEF